MGTWPPPVKMVIADGPSPFLCEGSSTREEQRARFHEEPFEEERGLLGFGLYNMPKSSRRGKGKIPNLLLQMFWLRIS